MLLESGPKPDPCQVKEGHHTTVHGTGQVHKQVSTVSRARKMQFRTLSVTDASPLVRAGPVVLRGLEAARHGESRSYRVLGQE